jgi:5'-nucleotidase
MTSPGDRPLLLLTNDDGIASPGLLAAAAVLAGLGDLILAAPATQQTGMGRSCPRIVDGQVQQVPLLPNGHRLMGYAVPGTPAQAVQYGLLALAPRRPALVVAGINYGENLGSCVTGSGTVGAALEAAAAGIPSIAISLETDKAFHYHHGAEVDWSVAADVLRRLATRVLRSGLPRDVDVLKVDVPADATRDTEWEVTRQSRQPYYTTFWDGPPAGVEMAQMNYRVSVQLDTLEADSDIAGFLQRRTISITPLSIDLTSRVPLAELQQSLVGSVP